jgi:hypothetical protein
LAPSPCERITAIISQNGKAYEANDFRVRFKQTDQLVVLSNPGGNPTALRRSSELLSALWLETVALRAGTVQARFDLSAVLRDAVV